MAGAADFYEDDEPQEKIEAAFDRGVKGLTTRPVSRVAVAFSRNERLMIYSSAAAATETVAAVVTRTGC